MSDEHAPLRLLRQVFGDDITRVIHNYPHEAQVVVLIFGCVDVQRRGEAVVHDAYGRGATMEDALRAAIAGRVERTREKIREMEREAAALNRLRVPVPE